MKSFKLLIILLLLTSFINAQEKVVTHYYINGNNVEYIGRIKTKSELKLKSIKVKDSLIEAINNKSNFIGIIIKTLAKLVVNKLADVVYKPERFAKNNSANCFLLDEQKGKNDNIFNKKLLIYSNHSELPSSKNPNGQVNFIKNNLLLNFTFDDYKNFKNRFKVLLLDSYLYNFTSVKLKRKHHKVNILIDITVSYFDYDGLLQSHDLKTIEIDNAIPKGKSSELQIPQEKVRRYIPIVHPIESISISVNEVNTRKKVWDKWVKIYTDNKDKINDFVADKIDELNK
ncbi:hypothetical protein SAMN04489761_4011 [Tenacibaculum sp. MAR_2009_124]|uniref:hypothetical protein n=1 Tax=Tenacibaculum sp. MAR_2009_124 TaxID=1250059 RepID=UPI0008967070|nr:hypothetical protein [Tenacibaculum sp. MAR_2009_124]SEC93436.1 hypothetical protein SAMN04489761_4011 [Tenacibaculum sp. MAR_2009_124]